MSSSSAAQILRQAETLKTSMTESGKPISELWVTRQKLEDLYKKLLILDLEYALDKKVEQELWNHAFKNQISTLQASGKDKQNPKKLEAQANLILFLETASGFYLQFLQMICSTFKLDLPFRRRSAAFGIMRENALNYKTIVTPKKSSCLYICCHCLVHLGDISRYRQQIEQAQTYYRHAANLSPNNGQPYNQLAILEASRGDKLSTVFYYVRSLAVRHPFPVAATNLEKFYSKLIKDTRCDFDGPNLTMSEIITAFLQFQALLHMHTGLDKASNLKDKIVMSLATHIRCQTLTANHLTGIVAISLFALHRARCDTNDVGEAVKKATLTSEEERCVQIHLSFAVKLLEAMLQHTPKEDNKARDFLTLPAVKVMLDWLYLNKDVLHNREFHKTSTWSDLCKLLNTLQWLLNDSNKTNPNNKAQDVPLPEDQDLRCFQPLEPSYSQFNFTKAMHEELTVARERDLRCQRLIGHGRWVAQDLPKLKLVVYQPNKSIRNQFSSQKTGHANDLHIPSQGKSQRQNVAMQTIMKKHVQKRMEMEKGATSSLSAISEENKTQDTGNGGGSSTPPLSAQRGTARQAGMISLHGKTPKTSLPPRLSVKPGSQNQNLSPRLQKKQIEARTNQQNKEETIEPMSTDKTPNFTVEDYPALTSQRSSVNLIQGDTKSQPANMNLSGPGWAAFGCLSDRNGTPNSLPGSSSSPRLSVPNIASSTGSISPSHSPLSTGMSSPYSGSRTPEIMSRSNEPPSNNSRSNEHISTSSKPAGNNPSMSLSDVDLCAPVNFTGNKYSPDMLAAIRSAQQVVQQQHQQQPRNLPPSLHSIQQPSKIMQAGNSSDVFARNPTESQSYPNFQQPFQIHQNQLQQQQKLQQQQQVRNLLAQQQMLANQKSFHGTVDTGQSTQLLSGQASLDRPGPGSLFGQTRDALPARQRQDGQNRSYVPTNIPPIGFIPPNVTGVKPAISAHNLDAGKTNFSSGITLPIGARRTGGLDINSGSTPYSEHDVPEKRGLIYQNTPPPDMTFNPLHTTNNLFYSGSTGVSKGGRGDDIFSPFKNLTGPPNKQDASSSQPFFMNNQQRQKLNQQKAGPTTGHSLMDQPPFMQPSGEYTLFSSSSSPAWPSPIGQPSQAARVNAPGPVLGMNIPDNGNNMQGLWSNAGPSPLERLLEQQQRNKRHDD